MRVGSKCVLATVLCGLASITQAQIGVPDQYDKVIQYRSEVPAFGVEGFGDRIDLASGSLEIVQVDLDLPGNNALPVRVARRFVPADKYAGGFAGGSFDLDLPYAHGIFAYRTGTPLGWTVAGSGAAIYKRCSYFSWPPEIYFQDGIYTPSEYWHGSSVYIPEVGDQEMLHGSARAPADGLSYMSALKNGAVIRCVPLDVETSAPYLGEGFEVVMPDGTIYTLNHMVLRDQETMSKRFYTPSFLHSLSRPTTGSGDMTPNAAVNFILPRKEVRLYPTKVQDRFGNVVNYIWGPSGLARIVASDGRQIDFTYSSVAAQRVTVTSGTRSWVYGQVGSAEQVTLPDGSKWTYNLSALRGYELKSGDGCASTPYTRSTAPPSGSITAPTGATATFTFANVVMGRSWVPDTCVYDVATLEPTHLLEPVGFYRVAVTSKKITGPGLPSSLTWTYAYGPANGCMTNSCTASSPTTRTVTVTDPKGSATRYTYGNRYAANEGLLLKTEYGWNGTTALRTVENEYGDALAAPYGTYGGGTLRPRGDTFLTSRQRPLRRVKTVQQGRTFTWQVASDCSGMPYCFDTFARPTKVVKASSP